MGQEDVTETEYATGVPMHEQEKQGGKCCGSCCDYRRAVIILMIISLIFGILGMVNNVFSNNNNAISEENLKDLEEDLAGLGVVSLALNGIHIAMSIICLISAVTFTWFPVLLYGIWAIIYLIAEIIVIHLTFQEVIEYGDAELVGDGPDQITQEEWDDAQSIINLYSIGIYVFAAIFTMLWTYPSCFLWYEIKTGIMTRETYPREEHSCCCAPRRA